MMVLPDESHRPLLCNTQAYLKLRRERGVPSRILVAAWEQFYRVHDELIRRFVIVQGVPHSDVDDCVQEVWSAVVTRLVMFEPRSHRLGLQSWLYTLARRKVADVLRSKTRHRAASLEQAMAAGQQPCESATDPAALCQQKQEAALLQSALAKLRQNVSETNYGILHMRLVEGHKVKEVATELNLASEQVRYRQHRLLQKLREYLVRMTHEGPSVECRVDEKARHRRRAVTRR